MISRRSTMKIAEYLYDNFTESKRVNYGALGRKNYKWERRVNKEQFKEFLYLSGGILFHIIKCLLFMMQTNSKIMF